MFKKLHRYWYNLTHPAIGEVWMLHRVTDKVSEDENMRPYEITPARLEHLVQHYQRRGFQFVSVDDVCASYSVDKHIFVPNKNRALFLPFTKWICVTLDDGYADNYEVAYPIFKKYNIPFCIFVSRDFVRGSEYGEWGRVAEAQKKYNYLTEQQLQVLAQEPLCTLGAHTCSHPKLYNLPKEEQQMEIAEGKQWLEHLIQRKVDYFAYPHGAYSQSTLDIISSIGFKASFAAWGESIQKNTLYNIWKIPRISIESCTDLICSLV